MPQLRDKGGKLLFEGNAYAVALYARNRDEKTDLFDDVGENFDPAAVIEQYEDIEAQRKTLARAPKKNAAELEGIDATLTELSAGAPPQE